MYILIFLSIFSSEKDQSERGAEYDHLCCFLSAPCFCLCILCSQSYKYFHIYIVHMCALYMLTLSTASTWLHRENEGLQDRSSFEMYLYKHCNIKSLW